MQKGKINKDGNLIINGKIKYCPYSTIMTATATSAGKKQVNKRCGDWCALFGENISVRGSGKLTSINICKGEILFDELIDER